MKNVFFILLGLVMMAGFLPVNANAADDPTMGCIFTPCTGTICDNAYLDTDAAADAVEFIEDNICDSQK